MLITVPEMQAEMKVPASIPMASTAVDSRWYDQVRAITEMLVAIPTISPDARGENKCAQVISTWLTQGTDLQPAQWPTGDGRVSVACLLRGTHPANTGRTVIIMGHYDTVGVKEYQSLDPERSGHIAFQPERLRHLLLEKLGAKRTPNEEDVWQDLNELEGETGRPVWLFGRGSCDMKSGVAINIALMRHLWAERAQLAGNVLFLACPDEETESVGVRTAVPELLHLRDSEQLTYLGLINTDYAAPRNQHDHGRSIYTGTIGKLLPSFYIVGVPTHVGDPFRGIDAGQIAAEIVRRINLNPNLCDRWVREDSLHAGEMHLDVGVPPISLKIRDLKSEYNVQTASEAFVYINWLTYTTTPAVALATMVKEAGAALNQVIQDRNLRYQRFTNRGELPEQYTPQVISYEELCVRVRQEQGWEQDEVAFQQLLKALTAEIEEEMSPHLHDEERIQAKLGYAADLRTKSRLLVSRLIHYAKLQGPAVVVFFSPPYYPHVRPEQNELTAVLRENVRHRRQNHIQPEILLQGYYPYISDLSFVCLNDDIEAQTSALSDNMPVFNRGFSLDFASMQALNMPVLNVGPWGKDAHGLYERVHMP
ncbi:MAG: M20/M25/M40 family metallo-hydrolase, partial [Anaerolineales bacterium]|nr:M20/M25/M40 family metallo-hydrolase [Anaerolineales bacterium]